MIKSLEMQWEEVEKNMALYGKHRVIIWGCGILGAKTYDLLKKLNVTLIGFCDNDPEKQKELYLGLPVLSPEEVKDLYQKKEENILLQLALKEEYETEVLEQLQSIGIYNIVKRIDFFYYLKEVMREFSEVYPKYQPLKDEIIHMLNHYRDDKITLQQPEIYDHIFVCQIPKTGDNSITSTYGKASGCAITHEHLPGFFNPEEADKREIVKLTTGVRDPLARYISNIFQDIYTGGILTNAISFEEFYLFLEGKSSQFIFDEILKSILKDIKSGKSPQHPFATFFEKYKENIIDVLAHPFDKNKGYTIIKEGNREVFVYQLERLNELAIPLSEFMGVPFDKIEKENAAEDKWVADYYKRALKELKFPESYVDFQYNDPAVKHFYSEADLAKFRERWKNNIVPDQ